MAQCLPHNRPPSEFPCTLRAPPARGPSYPAVCRRAQSKARRGISGRGSALLAGGTPSFGVAYAHARSAGVFLQPCIRGSLRRANGGWGMGCRLMRVNGGGCHAAGFASCKGGWMVWVGIAERGEERGGGMASSCRGDHSQPRRHQGLGHIGSDGLYPSKFVRTGHSRKDADGG